MQHTNTKQNIEEQLLITEAIIINTQSNIEIFYMIFIVGKNGIIDTIFIGVTEFLRAYKS